MGTGVEVAVKIGTESHGRLLHSIAEVTEVAS